jgi:hypothetical protein
MKYRSLLLHTCWSIYFWLVEFKLVFESFVSKIENLPSPSCFFCAAQVPKSGRAPCLSCRRPLFLPPRRSPVRLVAQRGPPARPSPAAAYGWVPPVISLLAPHPSRTRVRPRRPCRAAFPADPHARRASLGLYSPAASHRAAPFAQTVAPSSCSAAANPSRAAAVSRPVRRSSVAVKVARSFAAR